MTARRLALRLLAPLALVAGLAACAAPDVPPIKTETVGGAKILTDTKGMTLYVFDKDAPGKSNCNGPCATNWPPLLSDGQVLGDGNYTLIARDDGKMQWAVNGRPLYTWSKDTKPGDTTGDGFLQGAWHVAKP